MNQIILILSLTLWGECRSESFDGKLAVASVIYHRAHGEVDRMDGVCLKPYQFSCWNGNGRQRLLDAKPVGGAWDDCVQIATRMANGVFAPTIDADHYHTPSVNPKWNRGMQFVEKIGNHLFWKS